MATHVNNKRKASKPLCFVIMPFSFATSRNGKYRDLGADDFDTIFVLLRTILSRQGFEVKRSDSKGDILGEIIYDLDRAELVVADLTGLNPNVMYELGVRHAFMKKTLMLSQDLEELPFDLKHYYCIQYGWITKKEQDQLATDIRNTLSHLRQNPDTRLSPVHSHSEVKRLAVREEEKRTTVLRLYALWRELEVVRFMLNRELRNVPKELTHSVFQKGGDDILYINRSADASLLAQIDERLEIVQRRSPKVFPASDLFISSHYIPSAFDDYQDVSAFNAVLTAFRQFMHEDTQEARFLAFERIQILLHDLDLITTAVVEERTGERLELITQAYFRTDHGIAEVQSRERMRLIDLLGEEPNSPT